MIDDAAIPAAEAHSSAAVDEAWIDTPLGRVPVRHRNCPFCGQDNRAQPPSRHSRDAWAVKICARCGFTFLENTPEYSALSETIAWTRSFRHETMRRLNERPVSKRLVRRLRVILMPGRKDMDHFVREYIRQGRVIDIGCSTGKHLLAVGDAIVPYGVEIAKEVAAETDAKFRARGGGVIHAPAIEGLKAFETGFFDGAVLRSYLEHEFDPEGVLKGLHRVLRPGGRAIVKVPNFSCWNRRLRGRNWCGFRYPDHVNYFRRQDLRRIAERNGFRCTFIWKKSLPTSDNMTALFEKRA